MALRLSNAARSAAADAVVDLLDAGSTGGLLRIYTGSQPAGPGSTATGDLLAELDLADPAFGSASNGVAAIDADPALSTTGVDDGAAGWFRLLDSNELAVVDGTVTATGAGGDLTLNTTTISVGLTVEVTGGSITMPSGA